MLQKDFRNAFAIIVGLQDSASWLDLQCYIDFGNLRLLQAQTLDEIVHTVKSVHDTMKNKTKFELQAQILDQQKLHLTDARKIKEMTVQLMEEMEIPSNEAEQIIHHHKTFRNLVLNCEKYSNKSESSNKFYYSEESAQKLSALFAHSNRFNDNDAGNIVGIDDNAEEIESTDHTTKKES